jgi:Fe2+ transport system protein FeoA
VDTRDLPEAESKLLAAMGIGERCEIRVCRAGTPCIVQLQTIRVGIGREVADRIITTPCGCLSNCEANSATVPSPPVPPAPRPS